jgi:large subunit ribosomal protein L10
VNRDQKAAAIAEIAADIEKSQAVFAVDYRGISVPQAAELRAKLREADATFRVVKNSLTERAADQTGAAELKPLLQGPTALTFVRGDAALAAKAIADYARITQLLPFKGGLMEGAPLDPDQLRSISRLPSREVLYGQLVGVVASPVTGLVRTLGALVGGLAVALGQVREKKESGEIPAGEAPAVAEAPAEGAQATEASAPPAEAPAVAEAPAEGAETEVPTSEAEAPAGEAPAEASAPPAEALAPEAQAPAEEAPVAEVPPEAESENQTEPAPAPATDDNQADASAEAETAEANPKED